MLEVLGEDHCDRQQAEADEQKVELRLKHIAEGFGKGNSQDAVGSAGVVPVGDGDACHLAKTESHDREVVAAQPKRGVAEDGAGRSGEKDREGNRREEIPVCLRHEKRARVGADGEERGVTKVEQAGEADHDVEAESQHRVSRDTDHDRCEVLVALEVVERAYCHKEGDHPGPVGDAIDTIQPDREAGVLGEEAVAQQARAGQPEKDEEHGPQQLFSCHIRTATRSPNRPVGLMISTVMRTPKTITSSHLPEM